MAVLPEHLIVEFWRDVNAKLRKDHNLSEEDAARGIAQYRSALDRHQVGDMVYHRDAKSIAETIAKAIESGYEFSDPPARTERFAG